MTDQGMIWDIMRTHVPRREWISIGEILNIVESRTSLDDEDLELNTMRVPAWKLTVRRVLMKKSQLGKVSMRSRIQ